MSKKIFVLKIGLILIFIGCLFKMPYGYFQFIRFFGMVGFVILSISEFRKKLPENIYQYVWTVSAILINPFVKIALGRTIWNIVDLVWVIILLLSLNYDRRSIKNGL